MLPITTLQLLRHDRKSEAILSLYEDMMRRFFADRALIPAGNLAEVRFEDLERDPVGELRRVYERLNLAGYAEAAPAFHAYVTSQRAYRKNNLELSLDDRRRIDERWGFAFAELGYTMGTVTRATTVNAEHAEIAESSH
jgi:hypothetical protein